LGSLLADSLGSLSVVALGLRVLISGLSDIPPAPVVDFTHGLRGTTRNPTQGVLRLIEEVPGCG
jgi:hypothetical protein